MRISNWPPGNFEPERYVEEPNELKEKIQKAEQRLKELYEERKAWHNWMEQQRLRAWVEYHDKYSWPDIPDYEKRLKASLVKALTGA